MFDFTGKTAVVTGATQGIGFACASMLSECGAKVFINGASSMEKCEKAAAQIKNAYPVLADLTKPNGIERLYRETKDADILVVNASIQYKRPWDEFTEEEFNAQMNCNVKASYWLIRKYYPYMKQQGWGRIVTIGSVNQYNNHPELALYGATKAAQLKLVQNIAPYIAPYGVTINNIAPGAIETPRNDAALRDKQFKQKVIGSIPMGYIGKPNDIAPMLLFLCSDAARYITGADIVIDGGMCL